MSTQEFGYDVFLSHNHADKPRVRRIAEKLRETGLSVWFDDWAIKPGDDIYLAIERGLEASRTLVLCMSPSALASDWVSLERSTVMFRDPTNVGRRFIPLLLSDCKLPDALRRFKYVDCREESKANLDDLIGACQAPATIPNREFSGEAPVQTRLHSESPPSVERVLIGHSDWVRSLTVSSDGTRLVSASHDTTAKLWDIGEGTCATTFKGSSAKLRSIALTPDGARLLSADTHPSIRIWDVETGRHIGRLNGHSDAVWSIVALPDGDRALSASMDYSLKLWQISSQRCLKTFAGHKSGVFCAAIDRSGKLAISGDRDGLVCVWNLESGAQVAELRGHSDSVRSVLLSADGTTGFSGSVDRTVRVWNLRNNECTGVLEGLQDKARSLALSPDGQWLAVAGGADKTIWLWKWKTGAELRMRDESESIVSVAYSPDGSKLYGGTMGGAILVFRGPTHSVSLQPESVRRYVNAKVVLVGESGVGKTTLAHRLIEDRYVRTESTHGMNVWRLDLPLEKDETWEREALLWDLAGQDDYRIIHQLYLGETALALLLINPQKDDPFAEAGDWLKALQAAVTSSNGQRDVARLLVPTRLDVGGMKVSQRKIDAFLKSHHFQGCLPTSAKRGDNCSDKESGNKPSQLKQVIARHIPWERLPWTSTPRLLAEIKNVVVAMRDRADIRLLRFAELAQRLEQALPSELIGESDIRTAITLLANQGLVRPLKFGDLVLLRPELINAYAGAIIRAARMHKDEVGCVSEEAVFRDDFDFTGVERLRHRPDEELLLRALVQTFLDCSLCIRESEGGEWLLIFPSQYRRNREIPAHPAICVAYTFTGELQTIYTTLVVRLWYSRTFGRKELWQNAAEFRTSKGGSVGVVFEKIGDGEGKLSVFFDPGVPDEMKVVFIEFVHRHLAKYGRDLVRMRRYVCPVCGEAVRDMEAVQKRKNAGKDFIPCLNCDERVPFRDHIEECLGEDAVAQEVMAMDARAKMELDAQALEQILTGHVQAICGEANQVFRELTKFDYGIDGEVEFKNDAGQPSGRKIYVQLKNGRSYLRTRKVDGKEIFDVKEPRHLEYWLGQPVDVYLVVRDAAETIRWMNISRYLKARKDNQSRQIVFEGERLDPSAVWRVRDRIFPPKRALQK